MIDGNATCPLELASTMVGVYVDASSRKAARCGGCTTRCREQEVVRKCPALLATKTTC